MQSIVLATTHVYVYMWMTAHARPYRSGFEEVKDANVREVSSGRLGHVLHNRLHDEDRRERTCMIWNFKLVFITMLGKTKLIQ